MVSLRSILILLFLIIQNGFDGSADDTHTYFSNLEQNCELGDPCWIELDSRICSEILLSNGIGSTVIIPDTESGQCRYDIPYSWRSMPGILSWKRISHSTESEGGRIYILPAKQVYDIEAYLGPPRLSAGSSKVAMLNAIPLDQFGNPTADSTVINIGSQVLEQDIFYSSVPSKSGTATLEITSRNKAQKMSFGLSSQGVSGKEYSLIISPNVPANFDISENRQHPYADGNQMLRLSTSVITDQFGNMVSDGTSVIFSIRTDSNLRSEVMGLTVNGIATVDLQHPDKPESWTIDASVFEIAKSQQIELDFQAAIKEFSIEIQGETLSIGPVTSYLNQLAPDGLKVTITFRSGESSELVLEKQLISGRSFVDLSTLDLASGTYDIRVEIGGNSAEKNAINIP